MSSMLLRVGVVAVVVSLLLGGSVFAAQTVGTGAGLYPIALSDLVVKSVTVNQAGAVEFPTYTLTVVIRNIGAAPSAKCVTSVYDLYPPPSTPTSVAATMLGSGDIPVIAAGAEATVTIQRTVGGGLGTAYMLAVADAPTASKPLGRLTEGSELNNAFGFPFDRNKGFPQTFTNPAVK